MKKPAWAGFFICWSPRAGPVDPRIGIEARLSIFFEPFRRRKNPTVGTGPVRTDKRTRGPIKYIIK